MANKKSSLARLRARKPNETKIRIRKRKLAAAMKKIGLK